MNTLIAPYSFDEPSEGEDAELFGYKQKIKEDDELIASLYRARKELDDNNSQLRAENAEMREAHKKIKAKVDLWMGSSESTTATYAVPPWWNLGDISAAVLAKYPEVKK